MTAIANARRVNPHIEVLEVSATRPGGIAPFVQWLLQACAHPHEPGAPQHAQHDLESALRSRIAELEQKLRAAGLSL